jgi:hypothetical protein
MYTLASGHHLFGQPDDLSTSTIGSGSISSEPKT